MIKIKSSEPSLRAAAQLIKDGNAALNAAKKQVDNAKEVITRWLSEQKDVDLDKLQIGDVVNVADVVMITIGSQNRFDSATFQVEKPKLFSEYNREFATKQFKPLV